MKAREIRKLLRAEAHRAERRKDCELAREVGRALCGSGRVHKATTSPSLREKSEGGAVCLPEIAIYNAGYRKSENITAR